MTPLQLVHVLQLTDSFFPVGAFAWSDGLETAAASGAVADAGSLKLWLDHFLDHVFVPCDGLALLKSFKAIQCGDMRTLQAIDAEVTAIKPSSAVRNSSRSMGKRLLKAYAEIAGDPSFAAIADTLPCCNAPVAYAAVMNHRGIDSGTATLAFGYNRLAGMVSAALRLISIGQQQAQAALSEALDRLPAAAAEIAGLESQPLRSFAPLMDIAQMNHRYVYSRLFRS